jgi:hypothetical protein
LLACIKAPSYAFGSPAAFLRTCLCRFATLSLPSLSSWRSAPAPEAESREARAIDVTATITNLRTTCDESGAEVIATTSFDVQARRRDVATARELVLPYFVTIVRGGNVVVAKRVSRVSISFAAGQDRASTVAQGSSVIARSAATLPDDVRQQITRRRKAGQEDAAIDPLAEPGVRAAVARASFELLVGFQLTPEQLQYNATR